MKISQKILIKNILNFLNSNPKYKLDFNKLKNKYFVVTKSNNYFYHSNDILNSLVEIKHKIDQDYLKYQEDFDDDQLMYKKYYDELTCNEKYCVIFK